MKRAFIVLCVLGGTAQAGVMAGFGGREDAYLVGADKICAPIKVESGAAAGSPSCHKAASDEIAQLSVKPPKAERGQKAAFAAVAKGSTLTVTRPDSGTVVVTWSSMDPISKIVDVYSSTYGNVVAVEMMVRRAGRDQADVVAFDLRSSTGATTTTTTTTTTTVDTSTNTATEKPPQSPALTKAVAAARKAKGKAAIAAWAKVLAIDPDHSEAKYGTAIALAQAKKSADALAILDALAKSKRTDAVEMLVAARFDPAFASVRADPAFRKTVGLDRPPATPYEHIMGMGGTWEQAGTSCDTAQVTLTLSRDRTYKIRIQSNCEGDRSDDRFSGKWELRDANLVLTLPAAEGTGNDEAPCTLEQAGAEDSIHCTFSQDLEFVVRPVRR